MQTWTFGSLEWIWTEETIRLNLPGAPERGLAGSYQEVVDLLTQLGGQGWDVAGMVCGGDWIYWTLKRAGAPQHLVS